MNYKEAVAYLFDVPKFSTKTSLAHTEKLLKYMDTENEDRKIIHVAGTNGKGSVCSYLNEILTKNGFKTGMFTSPHLVKPNERIKTDGDDISDEEFLESFEAVYEAVMKLSEDGFESPTFFEYMFAMAMYVFKEKNVDYIILETGLGGRLDQTNVVKKPVVTVITEVGFDHMQYLGDTLEEIAGEKAGIIKPGVPVVFWGDRKECREVIEKKAILSSAPFYMLNSSMISVGKIENKCIDFSLHYSYYESSAISVKSAALYQTANASLAYLAAMLLPDRLKFDGHFESVWEGRMEEVLPDVYVDGAHNEDGIEAFLKTAASFSGEKSLLFSAVDDKRHSDMIKKLCDSKIFSKYYITKLDNPRAASVDELAYEFESNTDKPVCKIESPSECFKRALRERKTSETLFCAGSLYLVGEIKDIADRMEN